MKPSVKERRLHLFEGFGVELEYMIVDQDTLEVKPISDWLLHQVSGSYCSEVERGELAWSNELVLHVIELKTNGPVSNLLGLHKKFQHEVEAINNILAARNAILMPGAMHPWMDPNLEMTLWPHEYNPIYEAYDQIFDCSGHGWANLQSVHINLPFANDEEFGKLHAAIRVLMPLLPGLAASSPIADLQKKSHADFRLEVYRTNSKRIPSVTGHIIPEAVFTQEAYNEQILQQMYRDIDPYDPKKLLQEEWLNSRGAIARFDRGSIEIRVLDVQECPLADLAILRFITDVLKALIDGYWSSLDEQKSWSEVTLFGILMNVMRDGEQAIIKNNEYLSLFGLDKDEELSVTNIWQHFFEQLYSDDDIGKDEVLRHLKYILARGTLSTSIRRALPEVLNQQKVAAVYRELCNCLKKEHLFGANA